MRYEPMDQDPTTGNSGMEHAAMQAAACCGGQRGSGELARSQARVLDLACGLFRDEASTRGTHLGHQDKWSGIGVIAWLGEADGSVEAPASVRGRRRAGGHTQMEPMASSPPCGALGGLLGGGEAVMEEVEGNGSARVPWSSGGGMAGGNTKYRPRARGGLGMWAKSGRGAGAGCGAPETLARVRLSRR
jgi:hypothetical protein